MRALYGLLAGLLMAVMVLPTAAGDLPHRKAAVAGLWYEASPDGLRTQVQSLLDRAARNAVRKPDEPPVALVVPHAGYVYSGKTAGLTVAAAIIPDTVIVLCPKHTRAGATAAVSPHDAWRIPLADIPVKQKLAAALVASGEMVFDDRAHAGEHALEVELPFLWRRNPGISIVPVALGFMSLSQAKAIAGTIAEAVRQDGGDILIVASSDMSHQIPIEDASRLDHMAIARILAADPEGLYNTVIDNDISMCGVIPVTCALEAARILGATSATLVDYRTSADATRDTRHVVGYAGMTIQ